MDRQEALWIPIKKKLKEKKQNVHFIHDMTKSIGSSNMAMNLTYLNTFTLKYLKIKADSFTSKIFLEV